MATSGTVSETTFNTLKVIDHAFRRCRLPAQAITAEMHSYAKDALYLLLSDLANGKPPSWCIERQVYPMYQNQPIVTLDVGTVGLLNVNYLQLQELTGTATVSTTTNKTYDLESASSVNSVGIKWSGYSVTLTFQTSDDAIVWTTVGTQTTLASSGEWTWMDISGALPARYFRITSTSAQSVEQYYLGTLPQEVPLGQLNLDSYAAQSNKVFPGRPVSYYFKRDRLNPLLYLWPAPWAASETAQLVVWRHRHVMDVGTLAQEVEVPQRWMEAIVNSLAARMAMETPSVDVNLIPMLEARAAASMSQARDGDNDGSSTFIQPRISAYTR